MTVVLFLAAAITAVVGIAMGKSDKPRQEARSTVPNGAATSSPAAALARADGKKPASAPTRFHAVAHRPGTKANVSGERERFAHIRQADLDAAVTYAESRGMVSSIVVLDTRSGAFMTAGNAERTYAAASVTKLLIATRLLLEGRMYGTVEDQARAMIRRSDNNAAIALYPLAGGDGLLPWTARHYGIDDLGDVPAYPGTYGSTRITALGIARFYETIRADHQVWPWLGAQLHAYETRTPIGEPNDFGIAAVEPDVALKNGWNLRRDPLHPRNTNINSTGVIRKDRLAVVILSEGPDSLYFLPGQHIVTQQAQLALAGLR